MEQITGTLDAMASNAAKPKLSVADGNKNSMTDCVRRRQLVRVAIKTKARPGDPIAPTNVGKMQPVSALGSTPLPPAPMIQATPAPAHATVAPVLVAEPVGGAVGPIAVPPAPQQKPEEAPLPTPEPAASSAGGDTASLIAFLESVRCEQYLVALIGSGASEVLDLKDMQVSIA